MLNEGESTHIRHFLIARKELSISAVKLKNGNIEILMVVDVGRQSHKFGQIIKHHELQAFVEKFA